MGHTCRDCKGRRWRFLQALRGRPRESIASLCRRIGVARSTGYKWRRRFCECGETQERSRRPATLGRSQQERWRVEVRELRRRHRCGARIVRWHLRRQYPRVRLPAVRTIHRWLLAEGLVRRRRRRAPCGPRVLVPARISASRPNRVWSLDFKGSFRTGDGRAVNTLTITDVYSHYILALATVSALSSAAVVARLKTVFRCYGLPRVIRVDHGAPWYGPGTRGWTQLSVWWVRLGIHVEYVPLNGNACHEQMHRILKERTASPPAQNLIAQRARFACWKRHYNHDRPHLGAGQMPPATRYRPSPRRLPQLRELTYPPSWETLWVDAYGYVYWHHQKRSIGRAFAKQHLGLRPTPSHAEVHLGPHLLGTLQPNEPALRPVLRSGEADRLPSIPSAQDGSGEGAPPLPLHPIPDICLRCHGTKLSTM